MKKMFNIYNNVLVMLEKYRELTLISEKLTFELFSREMSYNEYVVIKSKCGPDNIRGAVNNFTAIINDNSEYSTKSGRFVNLLSGMLPAKQAEVNNGTLHNICFVSAKPLTSHIRKVIIKHESQQIYFEDYTYSKFCNILMMHNQVPKHTIVNIKEDLFRYFTADRYLPAINHDDVGALWIGVRPGMVVKLEKLSEITAYSIEYRICSKKNNVILDESEAN